MLMITPPVFCAIICLPAHLQPRNAPVRLIPTTVFQPFTEMSSGLARNDAPALLTMTSSRPHSETARSTIALTWSSWRTSTATAKVRLPMSRMALATGSRCSSLRLHRATSAPARANSIAMDLPMPVPPPVTMAVLPSREKGFLAMAGTIPQPGRRRLLRQGDLRLPLRDFPLDAPPQRSLRDLLAVALRAALQLVEQRARLVHALARRLGSAAHVVVAGGLGLDPRLLEVRHERDDPLHLAVEVGLPLGRRVEARAVGLEDTLEVRGELIDLAQVILHARAGFLGGAVRLAGEDRRPGETEQERRHEHPADHESSIPSPSLGSRQLPPRRFSAARPRRPPRSRARARPRIAVPARRRDRPAHRPTRDRSGARRPGGSGYWTRPDPARTRCRSWPRPCRPCRRRGRGRRARPVPPGSRRESSDEPGLAAASAGPTRQKPTRPQPAPQPTRRPRRAALRRSARRPGPRCR